MARITVIKVEKLFGYFNYKLALHTEEQLTIVHSPNGYGKTNLLRLINAFNKGDYSTLVSIPFRLLSIKFDDGQQVMLSRVRKAKVPTRRSKGPHQCFEVMSHSPGDQSGASRSGIVTGQFVPLNRTADEDSVPLRYPDLVIQEDGRWKLPETGEVFTTEQLTGGSPTQVWWQEPSWLRASRTSCPVIFIDTQRLYRAVSNTDGRPHNYRRPSALRVYSAARELARSIRKALDGFADLTVTLDGSFAQRFLSDADESMSEQDEFALRDSVRQHIDTVEKRRSELAALGLIDEQKEKLTVPLDRASLASLRFLSRYIVDLQVKLQVFDDLASRLTMLRDIINEGFFLKQLHIDKEHGFLARSTISGRPIPLSALSTGEQHELLMFYKLLFGTAAYTLVLIDEPELSLHVEWQECFIGQLQRASQLARFDSIVATYSPSLAGEYADLMISLSEQAGDVADLRTRYEELSHVDSWGTLEEEDEDEDQDEDERGVGHADDVPF